MSDLPGSDPGLQIDLDRVELELQLSQKGCTHTEIQFLMHNLFDTGALRETENQISFQWDEMFMDEYLSGLTPKEAKLFLGALILNDVSANMARDSEDYPPVIDLAAVRRANLPKSPSPIDCKRVVKFMACRCSNFETVYVANGIQHNDILLEFFERHSPRVARLYQDMGSKIYDALPFNAESLPITDQVTVKNNARLAKILFENFIDELFQEAALIDRAGQLN